MQKRKDLALAEAVGKRLQAAIKANGLTCHSLAQEVGIANTSMRSFLLGKTLPSLSTLKKLCRALKLTPNDIL